MDRKKMKELRIEKGMTQEELAAKVKTTRLVITQIETGRKAPSIKLLRSIAKALGVSAKDLLL